MQSNEASLSVAVYGLYYHYGPKHLQRLLKNITAAGLGDEPPSVAIAPTMKTPPSSGASQRLSTQIRLMMWRNFIIKKRKSSEVVKGWILPILVFAVRELSSPSFRSVIMHIVMSLTFVIHRKAYCILRSTRL